MKHDNVTVQRFGAKVSPEQVLTSALKQSADIQNVIVITMHHDTNVGCAWSSGIDLVTLVGMLRVAQFSIEQVSGRAARSGGDPPGKV